MFEQILYYSIFVPTAYAAGPNNVTELLARINYHIINPLILVLFALAFVQFVLGLFKFFQGKAGKNDSLEEGKRHILWGIIGMAIMVSVFGIMKFITTNLGLNDVSGEIKSGGSGDVQMLFPDN